jgi:opacity protein-like surface antigen
VARDDAFVGYNIVRLAVSRRGADRFACELEGNLITRLYSVGICAALLLCATTAAAQTTPAASAPKSVSGPVVNLWYVGASTGIAAVERVGGEFAGEVGFRVWRNLDISGEVGWFQDVVTRRRLDLAATLATFLQQTQGKTATSDVEAPATYGSVNFRWVFESQRMVRPYAVFGVGGARVELNPTFTLGGTDITDALLQYGVTLGADLTGHSSHAAITGGGGVLLPFGKYYADVNYRLTSIMTESQSTNVSRVNFGFGLRF